MEPESSTAAVVRNGYDENRIAQDFVEQRVSEAMYFDTPNASTNALPDSRVRGDQIFSFTYGVVEALPPARSFALEVQRAFRKVVLSLGMQIDAQHAT